MLIYYPRAAKQILLDTYTILWFLEDCEKLSKVASDAIHNLDAVVNVSLATIHDKRTKANFIKIKNRITLLHVIVVSGILRSLLYLPCKRNNFQGFLRFQ